MRKILLSIILAALSVTGIYAQNAAKAKSILDKTAKVLGNKDGASANFTLSTAKTGSVSGTISIKGNKFQARTPQIIVWYNGKTQWTYTKKNDEVNVSTPNKASQMTMNPYTFINIYRSGYDMSLKTSGKTNIVHLTAQNKKNGIEEMYIYVSSNYTPSMVKLRKGKEWTTISISNFKTKTLADNIFTFNSKEFPSAEIIDLR